MLNTERLNRSRNPQGNTPSASGQPRVTAQDSRHSTKHPLTDLSPFERLPDEVLLQVFAHLPPKDPAGWADLNARLSATTHQHQLAQQLIDRAGALSPTSRPAEVRRLTLDSQTLPAHSRAMVLSAVIDGVQKMAPNLQNSALQCMAEVAGSYLAGHKALQCKFLDAASKYSLPQALRQAIDRNLGTSDIDWEHSRMRHLAANSYHLLADTYRNQLNSSLDSFPPTRMAALLFDTFCSIPPPADSDCAAVRHDVLHQRFVVLDPAQQQQLVRRQYNRTIASGGPAHAQEMTRLQLMVSWLPEPLRTRHAPLVTAAAPKQTPPA